MGKLTSQPGAGFSLDVPRGVESSFHDNFYIRCVFHIQGKRSVPTGTGKLAHFLHRSDEERKFTHSATQSYRDRVSKICGINHFDRVFAKGEVNFWVAINSFYDHGKAIRTSVKVFNETNEALSL